jgi:hypothetical protein
MPSADLGCIRGNHNFWNALQQLLHERRFFRPMGVQLQSARIWIGDYPASPDDRNSRVKCSMKLVGMECAVIRVETLADDSRRDPGAQELHQCGEAVGKCD